MGTRMELYTDEKNADQMISIANSYGIDAQVIGSVEKGSGALQLQLPGETISYKV